MTRGGMTVNRRLWSVALPSVFRGSLSAALLAWLLAAPSVAAMTEGVSQQHSGRILDVNLPGQTIRLEEMGPGVGPEARPVARRFEILPETNIALVAPALRTPEGRWPDSFVVSRPAVSDLRAGDYVTVTAEHRDGRWIARSITIVRPDGP